MVLVTLLLPWVTGLKNTVIPVAIREQSFLTVGTRAEDFRQGYETYFVPQFCWGTEILRAISVRYKSISLEKKLG